MTRKERYRNKAPYAKKYDIILASPSLMHDANVGFLVRIAACFGLTSVDILGSLSSYRNLRTKSGSMVDHVELNTYSSEEEFLEAHSNRHIISCELSEDSKSIESFDFTNKLPLTIFTGHETLGVPGVIQQYSEPVSIPLRGPGVCLNTAMAANIFCYEVIKQLEQSL